jgi:phosphoribosylglycinamide formyltransferase 1
VRVAVFVGTKGRGSNLMALHAASQAGELPAEIGLVVGTKEDAPALVRAREAGIPVVVVAPGETYGQRLLKALQTQQIEAIALAGYLRKLPEEIVAHFPWRIINVHPALLPSFGGKGMYGHHVHEAVLAHGCKVSGCTVHFVDAEYDTGAILIQKVVPVCEGDTAETLAARILPQEHAAYIEALTAIAQDRVRLEGRCVSIVSR